MSLSYLNQHLAPALSYSSVPGLQPGSVELGGDAGFEPFITGAVVSLVGSDEPVQIRMLRDKIIHLAVSVAFFACYGDGGLYCDAWDGDGAGSCAMA